MASMTEDVVSAHCRRVQLMAEIQISDQIIGERLGSTNIFTDAENICLWCIHLKVVPKHALLPEAPHPFCFALNPTRARIVPLESKQTSATVALHPLSGTANTNARAHPVTVYKRAISKVK